jgi:hypothetical protein
VLKEQREAGLKPEQIRREEGTRFLSESIPVEWSFGGSKAFRRDPLRPAAVPLHLAALHYARCAIG